MSIFPIQQVTMIRIQTVTQTRIITDPLTLVEMTTRMNPVQMSKAKVVTRYSQYSVCNTTRWVISYKKMVQLKKSVWTQNNYYS